jgi:Family of unknown function (DUF5522)
MQNNKDQSDEGNFSSDNSNMSPDGMYYIEDGLYVFTEKFHLRRGYCCGNRCRHCPYRKK